MGDLFRVWKFHDPTVKDWSGYVRLEKKKILGIRWLVKTEVRSWISVYVEASVGREHYEMNADGCRSGLRQ
jgi:hypothetical protein